jgi:uncharacterized protein YukE
MSVDRVRVNPDDLLVSGARVDFHADGVLADHRVADARIGAAQAGWVGLSASALALKAAQWETVSAVLVGKLADHARALRTGAATFEFTDTDNARRIGEVGGDGSNACTAL